MVNGIRFLGERGRACVLTGYLKKEKLDIQ